MVKALSETGVHFAERLKIMYRYSIFGLTVLMISVYVGCTPVRPVEEPASWATQIATAQQHAEAIDPDVVLRSVLAGPESQTPLEQPRPLWVRCEFLQPSGSTIVVEYYDTLDPQVTDVTYEAVRPAPTSAELVWLEQAGATVTISPAQALDITLAMGKDFDAHYHLELAPIVGLHMNKDIVAAFGVPAAWSVLYIPPPDSGGQELRIWVDAQTGTILKIAKDGTM